jgi:hypothetical protein
MFCRRIYEKDTGLKTYTATFKKKDGSLRSMKFTKLKDLPPEFLADKLKGGKSHAPAGSEVVWDLELKEFRIFNWNTVIGEVVEQDEMKVL